jgi:anti-sigma B factor antagonist
MAGSPETARCKSPPTGIAQGLCEISTQSASSTAMRRSLLACFLGRPELSFGRPIPDAVALMPPPFKIEETLEDNRFRLAVSGELDLATAPELGERIKTLCKAGALCVVIDLRAVRFIDSSGLREIFVAKEECAAHHAEFLVVPPKRAVPRCLFEVAGVEDLMPWDPADRDDPLPA